MVVLLIIINVQYFLLQNFHIDPVSQIVQMEGSYHLLGYKDMEQSKYFWVWKSAAVKTSANYRKQQILRSMRKNKSNNFIIIIKSIFI